MMPSWSGVNVNPWQPQQPPVFPHTHSNPQMYVPSQPWPHAPNNYWTNAHVSWDPNYGRPRMPPPVNNPPPSKYPNLNPILAADTTLLRFDTRKKPRTEILAATYYSNRHSPALATTTTHMRLVSKSFPWQIDIVSPTNITCEVVWDAIFAALQEPIADSEWGLIMNLKKQRETIENAVKKRLEMDPGDDKKMKRIDFLGDATYFKGLERDDEYIKARTLPGSQGVPESWIVKLSA